MQRYFITGMTIGIFMLAMMLPANATTLTTKINVDDYFELYISTAANVQGTLLDSSVWPNWPTTVIDNTTLVAGTDYYIHVLANNVGSPEGFLGEFSLTGTDFIFSNGGTTLYTDTTNWTGNSSGWGQPPLSLTNEGNNGVAPWGPIGAISSSAAWIEVGTGSDNSTSYFSTEIFATSNTVPEPTSLLLLGSGLGVIGLAARRRRK